MKYYAGIGSRQTPLNILEAMTSISKQLSEQGYVLRSGGAIGADKAFEKGAPASMKEIFRPEHATDRAIDLASRHHPAWQRCNDYARRLHGRNSQILLGRDLDKPVDFVICWTPGGKTQGGTALGIRIAQSRGILIYNLAKQEDIDLLKKNLDIEFDIQEEEQEELPF